MAGKKDKFTEAACAACKGKVIAGAFGPPSKWAYWEEEIIMFPSPPPPPATEEIASSQPESFSRDTPMAVPIHEASVEASWPRGIQNLTLALTQATSLLEKTRLFFLIAKSALRPGDCHFLNAIKTDDLYNNIIHSMMESALYMYMANE